MYKLTNEQYVDELIKSADMYSKFNLSHTYMITENRQFHFLSNTDDLELRNKIFELLTVKYKYAKNDDMHLCNYTLTELGQRVKEAGGHFEFIRKQDFEMKRLAEIEDLKYQQLDYSVQELQRKLRDYDKIQKRATNAERLAILAVILSAITLLLKLIFGKTG
jgi:hypothetical protein